MCREKKKIHYISEIKLAQRNCYEEDNCFTNIVIDRVEEVQATAATNNTQWTIMRSNSPIET